jgi:two-component system sensor histidine kinase and response regulator WspE
VSSTRERLVAQFRELVSERLGRIGKALVILEQESSPETGKAMLREMHSLKGEARMMGFADINRLVHEMEELVRATELNGYATKAAAIDGLLATSDAVLVLAGASGGEKPDVEQLIAWLQQLVASERGAGAAEKGPISDRAPLSAPSAVSDPALPEEPAGRRERENAAGVLAASSPSGTARTPAMPAGVLPPPHSAKSPEPRADAAIRITQQSLEVLTSTVTNVQQRARRREILTGQWRQLVRELTLLHRTIEDSSEARSPLSQRISRVKDSAGELVRLGSLLNSDESRDLSALAEEITTLRMVPLSAVFELYPRMIRELGRELSKEIDLVLEGEAQRVDRSMLEVLKESLMHVVRNAVDHGLETPGDRLASDKSRKGTLLIRARRDGDRLVVLVMDDGRGLDPQSLRAAAVRKGILEHAEAEQLSDAEATELIFVSGFSSKQGITDLSGRGVGLDVVRTKLLEVGGDVSVDSHVGLGTSFELRLPISLTVAPILFVQVNEEKLCLDASSVVSAVQLRQENIRDVAGKPSIRVADGVVPYSSMGSLLGLTSERAPVEGELVLVLRGRGHLAALGVDKVLEERSQAIWPMKGMLSHWKHLLGATPMADGTLALVLSAQHLVGSLQGNEFRFSSSHQVSSVDRKNRVLLVDDSPLTRELLVSLLESVGYEVVQAVDGADALERLSKISVDIVVSDLEMPQIDGLELTARIKAHPVFKQLPVVLVTTRGSEADRQKGLAAGADAYVTKGDLVRQDLVDVLGRLLN